MPHSRDEPQTMRDRLKHFHMEHPLPNQYFPRIKPLGGVPPPPGLEGTTRKGGFKMPYDRQGDWIGKFLAKGTKCNYCGTDMYYIKETNDAFVMGCPYPGCPANPNTKGKTPWELTQKRPMGRQREIQF